jgi:hypothetical protein
MGEIKLDANINHNNGVAINSARFILKDHNNTSFNKVVDVFDTTKKD